jgi:hypothetical protein
MDTVLTDELRDTSIKMGDVHFGVALASDLLTLHTKILFRPIGNKFVPGPGWADRGNQDVWGGRGMPQ